MSADIVDIETLRLRKFQNCDYKILQLIVQL